MKTFILIGLFLLHTFSFTETFAQNHKKRTKATSKQLPHQDPNFHDDCIRYLYWYYVNYLDTIQHPIVQQFFLNYGTLNSMESIFEPLRKWEAKYRPKLLCNALVSDYLRFLSNLDTLPANYSDKKSMLDKKYYLDMDIHEDYSTFALYSEPISPALIKVGNVLTFNRDFVYANMKDDEQLQYYPLHGHTCIITDILMNDSINQITLFVTLNKPDDVYSLTMYDAKNDLLVENLAPIILLFPYKYIMNKYFKYPFPSEMKMPNTALKTIALYYKKDAIQPFLECSLNSVVITKIPNLYYLFKWYDKMKIPYVKTKYYNKNLLTNNK